MKGRLGGRGGAPGLIVAFLICLTARAAEPGPLSAAPDAPAGAGAAVTLPADEIEAFFDEYMAGEFEEHEVPGAVVVFVQDGRIAFAKGYGFADREHQAAMDPAETVLPVGSISKLLTTLAVMRLADEGRLDLNADVNRYLADAADPDGFRVESAFDRPLTLGDLLRHSDGLQSSYIGIATRSPDDLLPLESYLLRRRPRLVHPPGEVLTYSQDGFAIVGRVIERVTGEPFVAYMQRDLLEPLEMTRSTFDAPSRPSAATATGYGRYSPADPIFPLEPFYVHAAPAGGLLSTATDIGHFMVASLSGGEFAGRRIVSPQALRRMHTCQFSHHPDLPGWTYGFRERVENGERVVEHGGVWPGFMNKLMLLPERGQGIFVAFNIHDFRLLRGPIAEFLDQFYPDSPPAEDATAAGAATVIPASSVSLTPYLGAYRSAAYTRDSFEKLYLLLNPQRQTHALPGGRLGMALAGEETVVLEPVARHLFRPVDGGSPVFFRPGDTGDATLMLTESAAYERVPWHEHPRLHKAAFVAFTALFTLHCVGWGVRRGWVAWRGSDARPDAWLVREDLHVTLAMAMNLAFLAGLALMLKGIDYRVFTYGVPAGMRALLVIPPLALLAAAAGVVLLARAVWLKRLTTYQAAYTAAAAASLWLFLPLLLYWNLWPQ